MIAIIILSFITVSIVTIQNNSQDTKNRVVEEDKYKLQVETAFSRFEWDFSQIYSPLYFSHHMRDDEYEPESMRILRQKVLQEQSNNTQFSTLSYENLLIPDFKYPEKHTIEFFTSSNRRKIKDIKQSRFAWVRYSLEKDEDNENAKGKNMWVRRFNPQDPFNPEGFNWEDIKAQVLLRNVEKISFEYWSRKRNKWVDNVSLVQNAKNIIYGIKVILEWVDADGFEQTFIRVYRPNFPYFIPEDMYELKKPKELLEKNNGVQ